MFLNLSFLKSFNQLFLNLYLISYNEPFKNFLNGYRHILLNGIVQFRPEFICFGASKRIYIPQL